MLIFLHKEDLVALTSCNYYTYFMIDYVNSFNPDDRILKRALDQILEGKIISFPTDTNWVLAADPFSKTGVERLYRIKGAQQDKHFSMLCVSISQASGYAVITDIVFRAIKRLIPGPYTFIFNPTKNIPTAIKSYRRDKEIGIRIPDNVLCRRLVEIHQVPLLISSISPEMVGAEEGQTIYSYQIEDHFEHQVASIIDPGEVEILGPSSVIDFSDESGVPVILREGIGDLSTFLY